MAAVPPPAPGAKSRTARGTTGATGAAGGDAAASDCADAALAAAAGACGAATSSSSVSESGAPGAGGCRLLLLPLLLPPCLTMHSWSCCPRSRPQPLQHVRHGCRFVAGRVHRRVRTVCCTPYCGGGTCGTRSREVGPAAECWPRFSLPPTWRSALARPCTRTKFAGERATNEYVHSCRQRNHSFVAKHAPAWRSQSACYERALCQASRGLWHEVRWATPTARTRS